MLDEYVRRILNAQVYDLAVETPIDHAAILSNRLGNNVWLKREDLQPVFSFKLRGAYNRLRQLSMAERDAGVVAASAGNHAQGLALAAKKLNINATIVMPTTTPAIKVDAVKRRGATVVLHGDTFDEAAAHAADLERSGLIYVHPFDDPDVIAGQGTVAAEILRQHTDELDAVFIPVGGGGLAAGMAAYIKQIRPSIKIIAVEPADAACLKAAIDKGEPTNLDHVGIFADGVAVARIGTNTFNILKETVDQVITCNTDEICAAIKDVFDDTRAIAEPAGALALAGIKKYVADTGVKRESLMAVLSGANTNFDRLRYISERTEIGEGREAVFAVSIPEKPGAFEQFCQALGKRAITEFNYRMANMGRAMIYVGMQISSPQERQQLVDKLQAAGYPTLDFTDNEVAKLHVRHMVGGHNADAVNERIFRVEFPERPGALLGFLKSLGGRWNISMFHYRNHGAAFGRVLIGLEVPEHDEAELLAQIEASQYHFRDETTNPACKLFLTEM